MSGDELFRPKARIVRRPDVPRARVIRPDNSPMFEGPRIISSQQFIEEFRRKVGLAHGEPLSSADFWRMGQEYPTLVPILIYNPGNTWVLVRELRLSSIEVYAPRVGLYEIGHALNDKFWYLQPDGANRAYGFGIRRPPTFAITDRYSLPREPLARLGPIQQDPLNCGPLVMYAALVAKGRIKSP